MAAPPGFTAPPPKPDDYVDRFCRGVNGLMERTVVPPLRKYADVRLATPQGVSSKEQGLRTIRSPPELPGLSRPTWLVIAASAPTLLGWYGWYKFSVEEELFYDELQREGRATGCGGYGTLLLFSWCVLLGGVGGLAGVPGADGLLEFGALWILLGQVNLYRRVNELFNEADCPIEGGPPVHAWWALLPPPLDVVVGLRQVHYLARYWAARRGDAWQPDAVAEHYFPFIAAPRFTLLELARTPSLWFWFTAEWDDFDLPLLGADEPAEGGEGGGGSVR